MRTTRVAAIVGFAALGLASATNRAAAEDEFYRGKQISIVVPAGPGGGYGNIGQMFAPHFARHVPGNPRVIVDFQDGSGGMRAANLVYNVSARDGTVIALLFKDTPMFQVLRPRGVKYDMSKLNYLGSMGPIINNVALWHGAPAKSVADCMKTEIVMGATGKGPTMYMVPVLMNKLMGTKFKVVTGYKGAAPVRLAMENGEAQGMVVTWDSWKTGAPDWIREGKIINIAQLAVKKAPDLPDVPLLTDLVQDPEAKKIFRMIAASSDLGWYVSAPPGVPKERLATLRAAFEATMKDPAFLEEAKRRGLDDDPNPAEVVTAAVNEIVNTPKPLVDKVKKLLDY